ncbi:MAG: DUF327 family protein [Brevinematia bacterium]
MKILGPNSRGSSPIYSNNRSNRRIYSFYNVLERKVSEVYERDIENLLYELSKVEEKLGNEFNYEHIEIYKSIIRELIKKTIETMEVVEKVSSKNKDKVLKIVVIKNNKLKAMLDEVISKELSRLKIMNLVKELREIVISLKV